MKRFTCTVLRTALLLLLSSYSFAQNVTIDYYAWNPSSPPCNVFAGGVNVPATVGGSAATIYHGSAYGQPKYNIPLRAVELPVNYVSGSDTRGTKYRITYSFKANHSYKIVVTAAEQTSTVGTGKPLYLKLLRSASNGTTNPPCNGPDNSPRDVSNATAMTGGTTFTNYTITFPTIAAADPSLDIFAYPGVDGGVNAIRIRKIEITETAPPAPTASFTISPQMTSLTCGSTSPVTFTANNVNNTPNVTNHVWNLGSATNGWLYNGSPAPQTISTGTTNTITLTPDCGKALANVNASVTAGSSTYNTNTAAISIDVPAYSIDGAALLCSGNTNYTLNGTVCNSTVAWTAPPSATATFNSLTANPVTLTAGTTAADIVLTADVTSCGITTPVTLPVRVGPYGSSNYTVSASGSGTVQPQYWCPGQTYAFSVNGAGTNYLWTPPQGWSVNYQSNYLCVLNAPTSSYPPSGDVLLQFNEPCGNVINKTFYTAYSGSACNGTDPRFTYSPNPAPYYLNVNVASSYTSTTSIRRIQIIRVSTGITVFDQTYGTGNTSAYITTSGFAAGNYNLRIYDGSSWATYQFVK